MKIEQIRMHNFKGIADMSVSLLKFLPLFLVGKMATERQLYLMHWS